MTISQKLRVEKNSILKIKGLRGAEGCSGKAESAP